VLYYDETNCICHV